MEFWADYTNSSALLCELIEAQLAVPIIAGIKIDIVHAAATVSKPKPASRLETSPLQVDEHHIDYYASWREFLCEEIAAPLTRGIMQFLVGRLLSSSLNVKALVIPDEPDALNEVLNQVQIEKGPMVFFVNPDSPVASMSPSLRHRLDGLVAEVIKTKALPLDQVLLIEGPAVQMRLAVDLEATIATGELMPSAEVKVYISTCQSGRAAVAVTRPW